MKWLERDGDAVIGACAGMPSGKKMQSLRQAKLSWCAAQLRLFLQDSTRNAPGAWPGPTPGRGRAAGTVPRARGRPPRRRRVDGAAATPTTAAAREGGRGCHGIGMSISQPAPETVVKTPDRPRTHVSACSLRLTAAAPDREGAPSAPARPALPFPIGDGRRGRRGDAAAPPRGPRGGRARPRAPSRASRDRRCARAAPALRPRCARAAPGPSAVGRPRRPRRPRRAVDAPATCPHTPSPAPRRFRTSGGGGRLYPSGARRTSQHAVRTHVSACSLRLTAAAP